MRIEELWHTLLAEATSAQRRVDPDHPLDLYADFDPPERPGLVLFCQGRPPDFQSLKSIQIERRQRQDGRWSLSIFLEDPKLLPVFSELCRDIIDFTRTGVDPSRGSHVLLSRIDRWRNLLTVEPIGLSKLALRGLIGELLLLENRLLPIFGPDDSVSAWKGPLGAAQDFRLQSGRKIEVKTIDRDAEDILVNGLGQLDGGADPLQLAVVRLEETGRDALGSLTASLLIERLRVQLADAPAAYQTFNSLLRFAGWDDSSNTSDVIVRLVRIDEYDVDDTFPRLIAGKVPASVLDATYRILLPSVDTRT